MPRPRLITTAPRIKPTWVVLASMMVVALLPARSQETRKWSLPDAIQQALEANPDARLAQHRINTSRAGLEQAQATWWPSLNFQSGYIYTDNPMRAFGAILNQQAFDPSLNFNDVPGTDDLNVRGLLTVPLYRGGRNAAQRESARANLEASEWDLATTTHTLSYEVARAWFTVRQTDAYLEIARETVRSWKANLDVAHRQLDAGLILKPDVLDMEVRLATAEEDLHRAENASELARRSLGNLMGLESTAAGITDDPTTLAKPPENRPVERPELNAVRLRSEAAAAGLKEARSGYWPSLDAFGAVDYDYGWRNNNGNPSYTAGILLNWNVWDGQVTRAKVSEAVSRLDEAEEMERKTQLGIDLQVTRARLAVDETAKRIDVSERTVKLAEESIRLTRARFEEGLALSSQLIDGETALTAARVRHETALIEHQLAVAALRRALGLLQEIETP